MKIREQVFCKCRRGRSFFTTTDRKADAIKGRDQWVSDLELRGWTGIDLKMQTAQTCNICNPQQVSDLVSAIKALARRHGGTVEADGCGGYEILAPDGRRWRSAEVWCYPLPLSECESAEERQELLRQALAMLADGTEVSS